MSLSASLQGPFEVVFERLLNDATTTAPEGARGPREVGWIESFHRLVAQHLGAELTQAIQDIHSGDRVTVGTALIHGNPFQIEQHRPQTTRPVEAGDLLLVSERDDGSGLERQALLLQMKVGKPRATSMNTSTGQQASLYGAWPPVLWCSSALRALPGPHPRVPRARPCRAAQFGVIPTYAKPGPCEALRLTGPRSFAAPSSLSVELAATTRLDLNVDATPRRSNGWPRIVEDMLERAGPLVFGGRSPRFPGLQEAGDPTDDPRGRFLAIAVRSGPPGAFD